MNIKDFKYAFWWILGLALFVFCFDLGNREPLAYDFRHGVILRRLLHDGFSWIPMLFDAPYAQKPPLFFWILYPLGKLFNSYHVSVLTLPSALSSAGIVCLLFFFLKRLHVQWAIVTALILITTYPFYLKARMSSVDMLFAFFLTLAITCFFVFYVRKKRWGAIGLIIGLIAGFLTKGPIGILLPSAVIVIYLILRKDWRNFFLYGFSLAFLLAVCFAGWYGLCYKLLGEEFVRFALKSHTYGRVIEPPNKSYFYYLFVLLVFALPWSFPLVGLFREKLKRENKEMFSLQMIEVERFVFVWFSVIFLFFTFVSVKHLRYIVPLFPPMAVLAGSFFVGRNEEDRWKVFFWKTMPWLIWTAVLTAAAATLFWFCHPVTAVLQNGAQRYLIFGAAVLLFCIWELLRKTKKEPFHWVSLILGLLVFQLFSAQFVEPTVSYAKSPKQVVLDFEKVNQRQNPLGFYQFRRDDLLRYLYYSFRTVHPMLLFEPEKIIPTMKFMKYKRGHFVTYRKNYDKLPEPVRKDCVIMKEVPFRDQVWVNAKWRDPEFP